MTVIFNFCQNSIETKSSSYFSVPFINNFKKEAFSVIKILIGIDCGCYMLALTVIIIEYSLSGWYPGPEALQVSVYTP